MDDRERNQVQDILDHHNSKYGVHIKDRAAVIYPQPGEQPGWDWVCCDARTGDEIALVVKRLSGENSEETGDIIRVVWGELEDSLAGKLTGTFNLEVEIPDDYCFPGKNDKIQWNKAHEFRRRLASVIYDKAPTLRLEEQRDLTTQITNKLSFSLPESFRCRLKKTGYDGSILTISLGQIGYPAPEHGTAGIEKFKHLVSQANEQLRTVGARHKWLVLIEEGNRSIDSVAVTEELTRISPDSRSEINRIYYLGDGEVVEIALQSPMG
ncbi:MAG: hypothetical protein PHI12_05350 [Dehalococcoidales bacterium]|nr:hypothetical protein [Dehalococcoidales bacterium]